MRTAQDNWTAAAVMLFSVVGLMLCYKPIVFIRAHGQLVKSSSGVMGGARKKLNNWRRTHTTASCVN